MKPQTSFALFLLFATAVPAEENAALEPLRDYLDFAEYSAGAITAEQIEEVGVDRFFVIDTRNQGQYAAGHIPGAVNIEWRQILAQSERIPKDASVLLYCDTGLLSSKAHLALTLAGYENAKVLFGGFNYWTAWKNRSSTTR